MQTRHKARSRVASVLSRRSVAVILLSTPSSSHSQRIHNFSYETRSLHFGCIFIYLSSQPDGCAEESVIIEDYRLFFTVRLLILDGNYGETTNNNVCQTPVMRDFSWLFFHFGLMHRTFSALEPAASLLFSRKKRVNRSRFSLNHSVVDSYTCQKKVL